MSSPGLPGVLTSVNYSTCALTISKPVTTISAAAPAIASNANRYDTVRRFPSPTCFASYVRVLSFRDGDPPLLAVDFNPTSTGGLSIQGLDQSSRTIRHNTCAISSPDNSLNTLRCDLWGRSIMLNSGSMQLTIGSLPSDLPCRIEAHPPVEGMTKGLGRGCFTAMTEGMCGS